MQNMAWNEMEIQAFINGTKLPKEIQEINENHTFLINTCKELENIENMISNFKYALSSVRDKFNSAKSEMNISGLKKLNAEMPDLKEIIDYNFDLTLNGLTVKQEWETEEKQKERLNKLFKLPLNK